MIGTSFDVCILFINEFDSLYDLKGSILWQKLMKEKILDFFYAFHTWISFFFFFEIENGFLGKESSC